MKLLSKIFVILFVSLGAFAQNAQKPVNVDKIVAKIDNYYILKSDVENLLTRSREQDQGLDKCRALESLAIQKLLVAKAEIDSVLVEDEMVASQLDARMGEMIRIYGSEKNIVEQFNKSIESLKSEVRETVKEQLVAQKMQQTITSDVKITPNEVRRFFVSIPKDSLPMVPAEVMVSQIVRFAKLTRAQKSELVKKLEEYKERILGGEKFETLAKEYSEDQGSKTYGGDLGWAKRGQMVPQFEATAMQLSPGEMSDVVESDFGFHLIQTLEVRGQEYHARHILLRPEYNRLDMTDATHFLDSLRLEIVKDSITFTKAAQKFSEDEGTKYSGGVIFNPQSGSNRLSLDASMEPNLYFTLDTMKVGKVSKPLNYRSPDGKTGMRLLKLVEYHPSHIVNMKDDYEKIKEFAMAEKSNREVDKWFKEAIGEVYIKIDPEYSVCRLFEQ